MTAGVEWHQEGPGEVHVVDASSVPGAPADTRLVALLAGDDDTDLSRRAAALVREVPDPPHAAFVVDVYQPARISSDTAAEMVDALFGLLNGRADGALCVTDLLVRETARRAGASGGLREPWLALPAVRATPTFGDVESEVAAFLPGVEIARRRSLFGVPGLTARGADGGSVRVRLPRARQPMSESIAAAVDTLLGVRARFGRSARGIDGLSFDNGGIDLAHGNTAGQAEGASGVIVLAPSFAATEAEAEVRRLRAVQGRMLRPALSNARPMLRVDEVIAHECWHYLDAEVRTSGGSYVELNAALGEALGVESLELALRGRERDAPASWRAAHARLVEEVSEYAATNPREATAEMFSRWWCAEGSPVVARFGELIAQFFPPV